MDTQEIARFAVSCHNCSEIIKQYYLEWKPLSEPQRAVLLEEASENGYTHLFKLLLNMNTTLPATGLWTGACKNGHIDIVRTFIMDKPLVEEPDMSNFIKSCPILAAEGGHIELVRFLYRTIGFTMEQILLASNAAAKSGHLELFKMLLESIEGDLFYYDQIQKNAFVQASCNGHLNIIEHLLEFREFLPDYFNESDLTVVVEADGLVRLDKVFRSQVFVCAAENGHLDVLRKLEEMRSMGYDIRPDFLAGRALTRAAVHGHLNVVKFLLTIGDFHADTEIIGVAFIGAAKGGHLNVMDFLMEGNRLSIVKGGWHNEAFIKAAKYGRINVLQALLSHGPEFGLDPAFKQSKAFLKAAENGQVDSMRFLVSLRKKYSIDPAAKGNKPFFLACSNGHLEAVKYLISLPREINVDPAADENISFLAAVHRGHLEIVRFLLDLPLSYGIDPGSRNNEAVIIAARKGYIEILNLLLELPRERGVDPAVRDNAAFIQAASKGNLRVLERLVQLPATYNIRAGDQDNYAFVFAAMWDQLAILKFLTTLPDHHGVDPSAGDNEAIILACKTAGLETIKFLLSLKDRGVRPNARNHAPLRNAVSYERWDVVSLLLKQEEVSNANGLVALD